MKRGNWPEADFTFDSLTVRKGVTAKDLTVTGATTLAGVSVGGSVVLADTVFDDLFVPLTTTRQGATAKPDFDLTNVGFLFPKNDTTEILYFIIQLPHRWKVGSTVYPHVHWRQSANETPVFKLDYKWHAVGGAVAANFATYTISTKKMPYTSGTIHQISEGSGGIAGTGMGMSSMLVCKLYRDDNQGAGDTLVDQFDLHIEIDSLGSDSEYAK